MVYSTPTRSMINVECVAVITGLVDLCLDCTLSMYLRTYAHFASLPDFYDLSEPSETGYNTITVFPRGSRNINVTEMEPSENFLGNQVLEI